MSNKNDDHALPTIAELLAESDWDAQLDEARARRQIALRDRAPKPPLPEAKPWESPDYLAVSHPPVSRMSSRESRPSGPPARPPTRPRTMAAFRLAAGFLVLGGIVTAGIAERMAPWLNPSSAPSGVPGVSAAMFDLPAMSTEWELYEVILPRQGDGGVRMAVPSALDAPPRQVALPPQPDPFRMAVAASDVAPALAVPQGTPDLTRPSGTENRSRPRAQASILAPQQPPAAHGAIDPPAAHHPAVSVVPAQMPPPGSEGDLQLVVSLTGQPARAASPPVLPALAPPDGPQNALREPVDPRVLVFLPDGAEPIEAVDVTAALQEEGFRVQDTGSVSYRISATHVRHYHPSDGDGAARVAEAVGGASRDFTGFRPLPPPGTIEVWLAGNPRPAPAPTRLAGGRQTASPAPATRHSGVERRGFLASLFSDAPQRTARIGAGGSDTVNRAPGFVGSAPAASRGGGADRASTSPGTSVRTPSGNASRSEPDRGASGPSTGSASAGSGGASSSTAGASRADSNGNAGSARQNANRATRGASNGNGRGNPGENGARNGGDNANGIGQGAGNRGGSGGANDNGGGRSGGNGRGNEKGRGRG